MITYDKLMMPVIKALRILGGSATINEIYDKVVELEKINEKTLTILLNPEKSNRTQFADRLSWARTYLKKAGYLENSVRGVWMLTEKGKQISEINSKDIVNYVRSLRVDKKNEVEDLPEESSNWRDELHRVLIEKMTPDAFERLTQRLLRESGFIQVEVTGRTGDGGIDGKGIARINGLMSFHITFQCKKYKGSVGASEIRNFRGAITGRTDRGMFITTGSFTKAAIEEANRDGASLIDLIDGRLLADKLKELSLGIKTEKIEQVTVDTDWFLSF